MTGKKYFVKIKFEIKFFFSLGILVRKIRRKNEILKKYDDNIVFVQSH